MECPYEVARMQQLLRPCANIRLDVYARRAANHVEQDRLPLYPRILVQVSHADAPLPSTLLLRGRHTERAISPRAFQSMA